MTMDEQNTFPEVQPQQAEPSAPPPSAEQAPIPERDPVTGKRARRDARGLNAFENFYENFRNVPVKYVDWFIGVCVVAFFAVILLGILNR